MVIEVSNTVYDNLLKYYAFFPKMNIVKVRYNVFDFQFYMRDLN